MSGQDYDSDEYHVRAEVRRFKQHLLSYGVVVGMLFVINVISGDIWDGNFWFLWIAFFWGIALAFQAARLFGDDIGRAWEDRTVGRIMERRHGRPYTPPPPPPGASSKPSPGPRRPMRPEPVSDYAPSEPPGAPEPSSGNVPKEPPPTAGS